MRKFPGIKLQQFNTVLRLYVQRDLTHLEGNECQQQADFFSFLKGKFGI